METGKRPSRLDIGSRDVSARIYLSYWDALVLKDGVPCKRWFLQLIVSRKLVKEVLEQTHDSSSGGYFSVK